MASGVVGRHHHKTVHVPSRPSPGPALASLGPGLPHRAEETGPPIWQHTTSSPRQRTKPYQPAVAAAEPDNSPGPFSAETGACGRAPLGWPGIAGRLQGCGLGPWLHHHTTPSYRRAEFHLAAISNRISARQAPGAHSSRYRPCGIKSCFPRDSTTPSALWFSPQSASEQPSSRPSSKQLDQITPRAGCPFTGEWNGTDEPLLSAEHKNASFTCGPVKIYSL
jgi:hypothetical protein